jgi:glycosyltransferase involved in cell wall biosynthesis
VRILLIAADYPWPETGGARLRLANTVAALAECGELDLLSIVPSMRDSSDFVPPPEGLHLSRIVRCPVDTNPPGLVAMLLASVRNKAPFELTLKPSRAVRGALKNLDIRSYDLVWYFTVRAWVWSGEPHVGPTIVDIDDLEDQKILARLETTSRRRTAGAANFRQMIADRFARFRAMQWRNLHRRIDKVAVPVVCSDLDARRSGLEHVRVIPNGYKSPGKPLGRTDVGTPLVVMFQGTMRYPPNSDAARFLASEIAPLLATSVAGVQVRLVGVATPSFAAEVSDPPLVTVVGAVAEITEELARADLIVVPLRFGSGTRIKILEAFAHRIPVVSTSLGAEGLGLAHGVHLLIADDASGIAEACASLLSDPKMREMIVENAHALFCERYEASVVQAQIRQLVGDVAQGSA